MEVFTYLVWIGTIRAVTLELQFYRANTNHARTIQYLIESDEHHELFCQ